MTNPGMGISNSNQGGQVVGHGFGGEPIVAESNLMYEAPQSEATPDESADFARAQRDIISEISNEFDDHERPEFTDEELSDGSEQTPETPEQTRPEEATDETKEDPAVARGMERLIQREVQVQAREAAIQAREARVQALETEVAELRKKQPAQEIFEQFGHSPTAAVQALGHDPETTVRLMIAEQLEAKGQEVPPALKEFVKDAKRERRIKELEFREAQRVRQAALQQEFNAVHAGGREYVKTFTGDTKDAKVAGLVKTMPVLAKLARANQDEAHREIMEEIATDARARYAADPNGQPITYEEAAKRVEARLSKYQALFTAEPSGPGTNAPNKQAPGQKPIPPQNKPPVRPLKPWEKRGDDEMARALADAEREFHRVEAQNRRRG